MAPIVMVSRLSSLRPSSPPLRPRPPPDPPPSLPSPVPIEALSPQPCSSSLAQALTPHEPPDLPPCLFSPVLFEALSQTEPPDPPDASFRLVVHLHFDTPFTLSQAYIQNLETRFPNLASGGVVSFVFFGATRSGSKGLYPNLVVRVCGIITVLRPFIPSPQALTHILTLKPPSRMATKKSGGGGLPVSASDTSFAYGLLSPVLYRYLFGCVDDTSFAYGLHYPVIYRSLFGCFDLPTSGPCKVLHAHISSLFTTYSATVEWFRQLSVWVMLELRFMILAGDIPMGLVSFGSTFVTFSSIYIALARPSAVCSSLMGFIPDVGVVFVYLSSWWQVEEKFIVIFIPMNMDVAGFNFPLVPRLNQSFFLIFLLLWSKLDEQDSLVLQRFSSHRMLFSAYGAVCVVLRVTLDAVFKEAHDVVVVRFHMATSCDLYRHSIPYVVVVCLAVNSLFVFSFVGM
ncbi:unnamed protein product [Brassica oleracea var. botrytis]|uniref:Uncharacterized protein n=1 Tax=Brassica oleracea TaxID=3712 RepID=A0A3P6F5J2_BRAOL|nr:unnamed protein product [Brassica oleracea]